MSSLRMVRDLRFWGVLVVLLITGLIGYGLGQGKGSAGDVAHTLLGLVCSGVGAFLLNAVIMPSFDRSNGNESGMIAGILLVLFILAGLVVGTLWALFFGPSVALFVVSIGIQLFGIVVACFTVN